MFVDRSIPITPDLVGGFFCNDAGTCGTRTTMSATAWRALGTSEVAERIISHRLTRPSVPEFFSDTRS